MGVKVSPDWAQSCIKEILQDLDVEGYIDDCDIWTNGSFEEHLELVDEVLRYLAANRMNVIPSNAIGQSKKRIFLDTG